MRIVLSDPMFSESSESPSEVGGLRPPREVSPGHIMGGRTPYGMFIASWNFFLINVHVCFFYVTLLISK